MKIKLISTSTYPSEQGLRTVSANLKKQGHDVEMIFLVERENYKANYSKKVLNQLWRICKDADLIGVSSYVSTSIRAAQVISFFKSKGKKVVWGGVHATICPEDCIKVADYVARGECEEAFVEFVDNLNKDVSKVKNFWVRKENKIYRNEVRPLLENLDKLPHADYDIEQHYILDGNNIRRFKEKDLSGMIFFQTVRGCPNACTYCSNRFLRNLYQGKGKNIRSFSVDYVIEECVDLKKKFKSLSVIDFRAETFLVMPLEEIKEFADKYKKNVGIRFKCLADPHTVDEEKLRLLVNAGLTDIIIGIQSGSDRLNYEVYKRYIKAEEVLKSAEIINKFKKKLTVMYDIITTNPYETKQDLIETINVLKKLPKPYFLSVNNLVFFIGTEIYDRAVAEGVIRTKKDSAFDLNYWDRWKHIKLKKKNAYLNLIINLMRGVVTEKKYGVLSKGMLNFLTTKKIIDYNYKHKWLTYLIGGFVQISDNFREGVAKPVYRKMPTSFKVWYDRSRYK